MLIELYYKRLSLIVKQSKILYQENGTFEFKNKTDINP